jgi:hypothetical protein
LWRTTGELGCRACTNRRNRTSRPRRPCGGCSSWRRSSRPGCATGRAAVNGRGPCRVQRHRAVGAASSAHRQRDRVLAGTRAFRGTVVASYPEFLVLRAADGAERLIRYGAATSITLPAEPPPLRPTPAASPRRYQFGLALRELARRREPIRVLLADGTSCDGTIEAVGSDYLGDRRARPGRSTAPGRGAGTPVHRVRRGRRRHASSGAPMSGCLRAQSAVCSCIRSMYVSSWRRSTRQTPRPPSLTAGSSPLRTSA